MFLALVLGVNSSRGTCKLQAEKLITGDTKKAVQLPWDLEPKSVRTMPEFA